MALAAATVFAIPSDGESEYEITRSYLSDVIRSRSGTEKRAALRSAPLRTIRYTALFLNQDEAADFRLAWLAAAERLRFLVPLWPEYAVPTSFPTTSTIAADFTNRDFAPFAKVLVYQDRTHFEAATVSILASGLLTLTAPLVGTYTPLAARVLPLMPAWLDLPTMSLLETAAESVSLVFHEEVQGAAGVDPTAGLATTAVCSSLVVTGIYFGGSSSTQWLYGFDVHAFDAMGFEIPNPSPTWTITQTGSLPVGSTRFDVSADGREVALQFTGDATATFDLAATVGSVTTTVHIAPP